MNIKDLSQALLVVLIWGFNFISIKITVAAIDPMAATFLRFALTAILLIPFFKVTRAQLKKIIPLALVLGVGHFGFLFFGLSGVDAATGALLIQLGVPFSSILAIFLFHDKLGWIRSFSLACAFIGAGFLAGEPQGGSVFAIVAMVIAAFCWAWANILFKKAKDIAPLAVMGWVGFIASPVLGLMSLVFEDGQVEAILNAPTIAWMCFLYTVIASSIISYHLWYGLIGRLDVNQVVPFTLLAPLIGVMAGITLLDEELTLYKIIGGLLTLGGVAIIQFRELGKRKANKGISA